MKILDLTFDSPERNLSMDESLLDRCELGDGDEVLRFWDPAGYFVVLGYSNQMEQEANVATCRRLGVPILRRCSGGGTVLQGPGCLNYSLVLGIRQRPDLRTIASTNRFILERHRTALEKLLKKSVEIRGDTDLTLGDLKFSGNSQRRKKNALLFHGTFLLDFDIAMIQKLLAMPARQPAYRRQRPHADFLVNLKAPAELIKKSLAEAWGVTAVTTQKVFS